MNKTFTLLLFALIATALLLTTPGCKTGNPITAINLAGMYRTENLPEITGMRIFHESDSTSRAFIRYNTGNLLYTRNSPIDKYRSAYAISYKLFSSYESNELIDSASQVFVDSLHYQSPVDLIQGFKVKAAFPGNYLLEVEFTDLKRQSGQVYPREIQKTNRNSRQYFLPLSENDEVIFEDWLSWKTKFRLITTRDKLQKLFVSYYKNSGPAALPPFTTSAEGPAEAKPEKMFSVGMIRGESEMLQFAGEGFYHFRSDTSQMEGMTIYRFQDDYPEFREAKQLVHPLRYLTTAKEYRRLMRSPHPKMAVDSFWLRVAGNEGRALELISEYYGRAQHANTCFAADKEGWKSDRGMMYLIFGAPQIVYRRTNIETWIYHEAGNRVALRFDFYRQENPFTRNDYILRRQADFKTPWFVAVDYWRR